MSTKYRYFQYRILVRSLTLNTHVAKWDASVSPRCSFCALYPETTIHIFVECPHIVKIWQAVKKWFSYMYKIPILLTTSQIILNNYRGPQSALVNTYILLIKFCIYKSRVTGMIPKLNSVNNEITQIRSIEQYIAVKNSNTVKFERKWQCKIHDLDVG